MRNRIPVLFAALLVAALVAVVGVAAFSINGSEQPPQEQSFDGAISGRVASAILAVSVSTPQEETVPTAEVEAFAPQSTETTQPATTTTAAPTSTAPAATTAAADTTPPSIVITSPDDGATVTDSVVEFTGTSEPGATVSSGPYDATMEDDGHWAIKLVVSSGYNSTVFTATDEAGNEASQRIVVYYEPPTPTTTKPPTPTTTKPPSTTTTTKAPSGGNCPVSGSCSPNWPADSHGARGGEAWRSVVSQYWAAERVQCVVDLIQRESTGNPQANNPRGPYLGLLQHSRSAWNARATGAGFRDSNGLTAHPYNGTANIAAGAYLAALEGDDWWKHWPPTGSIPSCQALGAK